MKHNQLAKITASIAILVLLFVLLGSILIGGEGIAMAQGNDGVACTGVDFLFLIDQSRSMQRNDLHQLRKSAVSTAIDIIGDNALYHCPGTIHRIAVVGFGGTSTGDIYSPNYENTYTSIYTTTTISGTVEDLQAWKEYRDDKIKPSIPVTEDLVATDHLLAFKVASKIIDSWNKNPIGEGRRKKAVIMMTDGGPCINVVGNTCNWSETEFGSLDGYLKKLESYTDPAGKNLPFHGDGNPESVYIWIVAFADSTISGYDYMGNPALKTTWEDIAKFHGGALEILPRHTDPGMANTELTKVIADITDDLLSSSLVSWPCDKPLWVNPYQNKVTIVHVFKRGADPGVDIKDVIVRIKVENSGQTIAEFEAGRRVSGEVGETQDWTRDGPNERYVFYSPPPGKYTIEVKGANICEDIDVELGQVGIDAKVISPAVDEVFSEVEEPPFYDIVNPRQFVFQFLQPSASGEDVPVKEVKNYPLSATVSVHAAGYNGEKRDDTYILRIDEDSAEKAIYKSYKENGDPDYIRTPFAGDYEWHLKVQTKNPKSFEPGIEDAPPVTVLEKSGSFKVVPVKHFDFEIVEPQDDELILAYDIKDGKKVPVPIDVGIQLVDEDKEHIDPALVLADETTDTFEVTLLNDKGIALETVKVRPKFGEPLLYATLRNSSTSPIDDPGDYRLSVRLLGNYKRDQYRPITDNHEVFFKRTEPQAFTFSISSPPEDAILPLEEGKLKQPLVAMVQIQDENGDSLLANQFVDSEESTPFEAILKDSSGKTLDRKSLRLSTKENAFVAELAADDTNPLAFLEGNYLILVHLTDDYKFEIFRPQNQSATRTFHVQPVQSFSWHISSPISNTTYPLHPILRWFPDPQPLPLEVLVTGVDLPSGSVGLLKTPEDILFTGELQDSQADKSRPISYSPIVTETEQAKSGQFFAIWPKAISCPGDYSLRVTIHEDKLSPAYILKEGEAKEQTIAFQRNDSFLSHPWSLLMLLLLIPLAIVEVIILYFATGPLANAGLAFSMRGMEIGSVDIFGRLNRRKHTVKQSTLDQELPDLNLSKIVAKGSGDGAEIELYWIGDIPGETVDEADDTADVETEQVELDFDENADTIIGAESNIQIELMRERTGFFSKLTGPVIISMLIPILVWLAVLGYFIKMFPPC